MEILAQLKIGGVSQKDDGHEGHGHEEEDHEGHDHAEEGHEEPPMEVDNHDDHEGHDHRRKKRDAHLISQVCNVQV